MRIMRNVLVSAVLMMGGSLTAFAEDARKAEGVAHQTSEATDRAVGSQLPPKFRVLIIKEMLAVLDASKQILEALVRGQDDVVARNAQGIHDSFVLEQEMSEADSKAFHDALPHAFVERDQAFHALSARLAEAAREGDQPRQREVFTEMLNACVSCHTAHATDRFPDLSAGGR